MKSRNWSTSLTRSMIVDTLNNVFARRLGRILCFRRAKAMRRRPRAMNCPTSKDSTLPTA